MNSLSEVSKDSIWWTPTFEAQEFMLLVILCQCMHLGKDDINSFVAACLSRIDSLIEQSWLNSIKQIKRTIKLLLDNPKDDTKNGSVRGKH